MTSTEQATSSQPSEPRFDHDRVRIPLKLSLPPGAQPDIIRANQKDVYYEKVLEEKVVGVFQDWLGPRRQLKHQNELNLFSKLAYLTLTTLLGSQTLGEEYCDILQVTTETGVYPSLIRRVLLVFLNVCTPYLATKGLTSLKKASRQRQLITVTKTEDQSVKTKVQNWLTEHSSKLQTFFTTYLRSAHMAVFYFFGAYYHFSKRFTGIRYIFTRQLRKGEERVGYEILGVLIVIQLLVKGILSYRERLTDKPITDLEEETDADLSYSMDVGASSSQSCTLCLSPRKNTTATPCGHLFCWTCICEWCRNKPECPLCRQPATSSKLLLVQNY